MANPNPSPATRFSADNPGRAKQKGARDRLSAAFLKALADDFEKHGAKVIETVRKNEPAKYLATVGGVVPKELEVTRSPLEGLSDEDLQTAIHWVTANMRPKAEQEEPVQPTKPRPLN